MHENIAKSQFEVPAQEATKRTAIQANVALTVCKWALWALALPVIGAIIRPEAWQAWAAIGAAIGTLGGVALFRLPKTLADE